MTRWEFFGVMRKGGGCCFPWRGCWGLGVGVRFSVGGVEAGAGVLLWVEVVGLECRPWEILGVSRVGAGFRGVAGAVCWSVGGGLEWCAGGLVVFSVPIRAISGAFSNELQKCARILRRFVFARVFGAFYSVGRLRMLVSIINELQKRARFHTER